MVLYCFVGGRHGIGGGQMKFSFLVSYKKCASRCCFTHFPVVMLGAQSFRHSVPRQYFQVHVLKPGILLIKPRPLAKTKARRLKTCRSSIHPPSRKVIQEAFEIKIDSNFGCVNEWVNRGFQQFTQLLQDNILMCLFTIWRSSRFKPVNNNPRVLIKGNSGEVQADTAWFEQLKAGIYISGC